ncbi:MAG: hypothetical protein K0R03_2272 [Moraxellaceae bacterium]|jgi:AraC-like DNA-binding protein|nr:hypothetical protein [Moraxellaceae bacterium]
MNDTPQEAFLPLFVLQMPQKMLSRFDLSQADWIEFLGALLDIDIGESDLNTSVVSHSEFVEVFRFAVQRFGREGLLEAYVEDIRARHMGPIGLAMESAPTFGDAMAIWREHGPLLAPALEIAERETAEHRIFEIRLGDGFGDVAEAFLELVLLMTAGILRNTAGGQVQPGVALAHARALPAEFYRRVGFAPEFGAPVSALAFRKEDATRSNDYYAPLMYQQALAGIAELRENIRNHARLGYRVRKYLEAQAEEGSYPHLEEVAACFNQSSRSFARHLREEGLSYRELRTEIQIGLASRLLLRSRLPVKTIADRAGFTNISAFSRAFTQATGQSPQEFRRAQGEAVPEAGGD